LESLLPIPPPLAEQQLPISPILPTPTTAPPPPLPKACATCDYAIVYEHINYLGRSEKFNVDESDADLSDNVILAKTISSVRLVGRATIKLFTEIFFGGQSEIITRDDSDLRNNALGQDYASALQVFTSTEAPAPSACVLDVNITSYLAFGEVGAQVRALQNLLKCLGYLSIAQTSTGYYGSLTTAAVSALQRANNLPDLGVVGPMTRRLLNAWLTEQ